jgi:hypothetical protein
VARKSSRRRVSFDHESDTEITESVLAKCLREAAQEGTPNEYTGEGKGAATPAGLKPIKRQKFGEIRELG